MPDPVTPAEIAEARDDFDDLLPDRCTISRAVDVSDGGGGQTTQWTPVHQDVPCRVAAAGTGGQSKTADRLLDTTTHIVTFAAGTDVQVGDQLATDLGLLEVLLVRAGGAWELTRPVEARIAVT